MLYKLISETMKEEILKIVEQGLENSSQLTNTRRSLEDEMSFEELAELAQHLRYKLEEIEELLKSE